MLIDCVLHIVHLYIFYRTALCKKNPKSPIQPPPPNKISM